MIKDFLDIEPGTVEPIEVEQLSLRLYAKCRA